MPIMLKVYQLGIINIKLKTALSRFFLYYKYQQVDTFVNLFYSPNISFESLRPVGVVAKPPSAVSRNAVGRLDPT